MRCALCQALNSAGRFECVSCGSILTEERHREIQGISYLLGEVGKWGAEQRYTPEILSGLNAEYSSKRSRLESDLRVPKPGPANRPQPQVPGPSARTLPAPATLPALRVAPMIPVTPVAAPRPPEAPFAWKNLCTEANIRWVLNLGIFIFSVALAVFVRTQWQDMAAGLKIVILYGASFAAIGVGHALRRTILKATGTALVALGAIAIPIDCAALLQFQIVGAEHADRVGLWGSALSLAVYLGLSRLYGESRFVHLATLAAASLWTFTLRSCGMAWEGIAPWIATVSLAGLILGGRAVRICSTGILGTSLAVTLGLLAVGSLAVGRDVVALEVALASGVASMIWAERRGGSSRFQWGTVAFLGMMYAVAAGHSNRDFGGCWMSLALLGAAFGGAWMRKGLPFRVASLVAGVLAVAAALPDPGRVAGALAIPAALHAAYGIARNDDRHAFAGWLLAGMALALSLEALQLPRLWRPLLLGGYGVALAALSYRRTPRALRLLSVLGAGTAILLLAAWYPSYYLPKPFPAAAAPPGGQLPQILGSAIALVSALSFGLLAHALRSRFVSDVTYACVGFSYILALRWAGMEGKWLGLCVALFGLAYALVEKRVSRWLLRPTLFTGIACTVAAAAFASLQWFVFREYLQSALTFLLVGGFYLAVAQKTRGKGLFHVGVYLATAGLLVGLQGMRLFPEARALVTFVPAALTLVFAARRRELHLGLAALVVASASLAVIYLDPAMYEIERLPYVIAGSVAAAVLAGWFAFARSAPGEVDNRLMSGMMAAFGSAAYVLWLRTLSTGSPWGALVVVVMTVLLCSAAELLRRKGFARQAPPLVGVSLATTLLAIFLGHERGFAEGVHLWIYGLGLVLYTSLARTFRREAFGWAGFAAGAAGLVFWLLHWETPWIGVWTFPLTSLALQRTSRPLAALGALALLLAPASAALGLHGIPGAGLVFVGMAAALASTRLRVFSLYPMLLGFGISLARPEWAMAIAFSGFALYLALSLRRREPFYLYVSLVLALLGDYLLAVQHPQHAGLVAYPLALVLFAMAKEVGHRFGDPLGWPLRVAGFVAALMATLLGLPLENDRILVLLADAILFGATAAVFRSPGLMYPCSAALVALDLALMWKFHMRPTLVAFQLLTLALGKIIFVRLMGGRMKSYLQPVYIASLLIAAGVLCFGLSHSEEYTARSGDIHLAIWGLMMIALTLGLAGRIRKLPAFLYLAAVHLLGAYYLVLYKYQVETTECFTLPIGVGLAIWSALGFREKRVRDGIEMVAAAVFFLPSAVQSFDAGGGLHTLYALGLAFGTVLAGMAMKRRVFLFGGTGAFVIEVAGKAIQFLLDRHLSVAGWGMILGGIMIALAALFESRKAQRVRDQIEFLRGGARRYFANWE